VVASGTGRATFTPTGRNGFGLNEYTVMVKLAAPGFTLTEGTYHMAVIPYCTKASDSNCSSARYFESDVEAPISNSKGRQPNHDAFFTSAYFGYNFAPTWGPTGVCGGIGCDRFSTGLIGQQH
jgi:hypothetical protein